MADPSERSPPKYWFPAKRYGWGWGPPTAWQGWVVLVVWMVILTVGSVRLAERPLPLVVFIVITAGTLLAICYAKGEPPRWRWGDRGR
ncbi:MAG TPA: hypothetical protein VGL59_01710 [Polyangia bacterium]|jgi:hypothetical protein